MWSVCKPSSDEIYTECALIGKNLSRLLQPAVLSILNACDEPLHGYIIANRIAETPMYGGHKPDTAGLYRTLKQMETSGLLSSSWTVSDQGPSKKCYTITEKGIHSLGRWLDTLGCYIDSISDLRVIIASSLDIPLPTEKKCCNH